MVLRYGVPGFTCEAWFTGGAGQRMRINAVLPTPAYSAPHLQA